MDRIQQQQTDTIHDKNKKQKLKNENCGIFSFRSLFEDLANEILYEIFEYLDTYHVYDGFFNLNERFKNLILNSNLPIQINISRISKSNFECYHENLIVPNKHRINYLRLSNPFMIDIVFSSPRIISKFLQLETLILDNINTKYLNKIIKHSIRLPNLHSLVLTLINHIQDLSKLFIYIFRLSKLKSLKIKYRTKTNLKFSFLSTNEYSPIEYLEIHGHIPFHSFNNLLSYLPQLHYLSIKHLDGSRYEDVELIPVVLKHLKYVSLELDGIHFKRFERIVKTFFHYVEVLRLTTKFDEAYLDAKRWEQLIGSYMTNLRIFDINHFGNVENNDLTYHNYINRFNSSFWIEKQWFFAHQHDWKRPLNYGVFYSTNPYRRKDYTFYWEMDRQICSQIQETNLNSVKHVRIYSKRITDSCINYFPNATELTIKNNFKTSDDSISTTLNRIIPLTQLTKLVIEGYDFPFQQIVKLLYFTSNLHTLKLDLLSLDAINLNLRDKNDIFQHVSIKHFELHDNCTLQKIQSIINLFPQLEYLKTRMNRREIGQIIRYLLSKMNSKTHRLFYLRISEIPKTCLQELNQVFTSTDLLDDYSIKFINRDLYLWW